MLNISHYYISAEVYYNSFNYLSTIKVSFFPPYVYFNYISIMYMLIL